MGHVELVTAHAPDSGHRLATQTPARLAGLRAALAGQGLAGLLIYARGETESAGAVRHLTGFMPNGESVCWIPASGEPVAICNDKNAARAWALVLRGKARVIKTADLIAATRGVVVSSLTAGDRIALAGFDEATRTRAGELHAVVAEHEAVDGAAIVTRLRSRPSRFEEDRLRAATRVADAMVQRCMQVAAFPGVTGLDIMSEVEYLGRRMGADRASCWLAIGERPAETYMQGFELATRVTPADRVQIGTTVMLDGYFSQVLRIGVLAEPAPRLVEVSRALIEMQDRVLEAMRPGRPVTEIGDVLEAMIDDFCPYARWEDPFRFQSCHAMGNSYSEPWSAPFLNPDRDRGRDGAAPAVAAHQAYEIHPNFTLPDLGHVCAGDVGLVTETGAEWISRTPRGLLRLA